MTERDRRALLFGGAVTVGAVMLLRVLPWTVRSALAAESTLQERAVLLARARASLMDASGLRDSAAALGVALVGLAPKILSGRTPTEATADLAGRVNLAVAGHQAKLERMDPVPDSARGGRLRRTTLRAAFGCDVRGLAGVLQALELGKAALTVRELHVVAVDPGSPDRQPEALRVEVTVTGWYLQPRGENSKRDEGAR